MKVRSTLSIFDAVISLCLTALIAFASTASAQEQPVAGPTTSGPLIQGQRSETVKPVEPTVLGTIFYLNPTTHTMAALPKETWTSVGKSKPSGFSTRSAIGSLQFPGLSSSFRIPASDKSEFVFTTADPSGVKLYMCSQNEKKKLRKIDIVAVKRSGVFVVTATETPIDSIAIDISKYGEASYKLTAGKLAPGEYVILNGATAFTFGVP